ERPRGGAGRARGERRRRSARRGGRAHGLGAARASRRRAVRARRSPRGDGGGARRARGRGGRDRRRGLRGEGGPRLPRAARPSDRLIPNRPPSILGPFVPGPRAVRISKLAAAALAVAASACESGPPRPEVRKVDIAVAESESARKQLGGVDSRGAPSA